MFNNKTAQRVAVWMANRIGRKESRLCSFAYQGSIRSKDQLIAEINQYHDSLKDQFGQYKVRLDKEEKRNFDRLIYFIRNGKLLRYDARTGCYFASWYEEKEN